MKAFLIATAAASALMLSACSEEPEVVETEELGTDEAVLSPDATSVAEPVALTTWDTNNDGVFQEAEYTAWGQNGITAWDTDADNRLSADEFNTGWTGAGFNDSASVFSAWDDDSDGYLTSEEYFDDEEWTEWDANSSGVLETTEFGYY